MRLKNVLAISFDLDDTLWPFGPCVERAEGVLYGWLLRHAPRTADVLASPRVLSELRLATERERTDLAHDLSALRLESIRTALALAGEDAALAGAAYEVFIAERQRVDLYDDVLLSLQWLSDRYPLVAVTNGNGDLKQAGIDQFFQATLSATVFGRSKPDASIFHAAAASIGVPSPRLLHVGDDPKLDVAGALGAGLQAAWVVRAHADAAPHWPNGQSAPHLIVRDLREVCRALDSSRSTPGSQTACT